MDRWHILRYNASGGSNFSSNLSFSLSSRSGSVFFIKCRSEANNEPCWQVSVPKSLCMIDLTWMDWQVRRQASRSEPNRKIWKSTWDTCAYANDMWKWGSLCGLNNFHLERNLKRCRSSSLECICKIQMHIQKSALQLHKWVRHSVTVLASNPTNQSWIESYNF